MKQRKIRIRRSKSDDFLKQVRQAGMIEYLIRLKIMNQASLRQEPQIPRREGAFVTLAHAREEFVAPVLSKGKSVSRKQRRKR